MFIWREVFDPGETKDYSVFYDEEMNATGDLLSSATFTLPADAIAAGLRIDSQGIDIQGQALAFTSQNGSVKLDELKRVR